MTTQRQQLLDAGDVGGSSELGLSAALQAPRTNSSSLRKTDSPSFPRLVQTEPPTHPNGMKVDAKEKEKLNRSTPTFRERATVKLSPQTAGLYDDNNDDDDDDDDNNNNNIVDRASTGKTSSLRLTLTRNQLERLIKSEDELQEHNNKKLTKKAGLLDGIDEMSTDGTLDGIDEMSTDGTDTDNKSIAKKKKKKKMRYFTEHKRNVGPYTVLAFVNSKSGGQQGQHLYDELINILGLDFVFDLSKCVGINDDDGEPNRTPTDILEPFAMDAQVRVLACGGDGTMGWIESSVDAVWSRFRTNSSASNRNVITPQFIKVVSMHFPLAIIPLGTGNDLSRCFGWGKRYQPISQRDLFFDLQTSKGRPLDRWRCVVIPDQAILDEHKHWIPDMLGTKQIAERSGRYRDSIFHNVELSGDVTKDNMASDDDNHDQKRDKNDKLSSHEQSNSHPASTQSDHEDNAVEHVVLDGIFCNYFSIGFDALVAFEFHKDRREHPERYTSVNGNKMKYAMKGITHGTKAPKLQDKLTVLVSSNEGPEATRSWEELSIPNNCRAVVLLNISSYAGGTQLSNETRCDDQLMDVIFMTSVWRLATITGLGKTFPGVRHAVAAQAKRVCIKTHENLHCQVDGEPWLQGPATINVRHFGQRTILERPADQRFFGECCSAQAAVDPAASS